MHEDVTRIISRVHIEQLSSITHYELCVEVKSVHGNLIRFQLASTTQITSDHRHRVGRGRKGGGGIGDWGAASNLIPRKQ